MILEEELNENLNVREIISYYLKYWKYFVFSVLIFTFSCFIYLKYTTPLYTVTTSILVKDDENGISDQIVTENGLKIHVIFVDKLKPKAKAYKEAELPEDN